MANEGEASRRIIEYIKTGRVVVFTADNEPAANPFELGNLILYHGCGAEFDPDIAPAGQFRQMLDGIDGAAISID